MTRPRLPLSEPLQALQRFALRYPEAQKGISCEGTSAEKLTITARNKAFLFLGVTDVMVKLRDSLAEVTRLAAKEPGRYKAGAHGWVTVTFGDDEAPPPDLLEKWVDESYRVVVNKQLVALLPPHTPPTAKKKTARKKTVSR